MHSEKHRRPNLLDKENQDQVHIYIQVISKQIDHHAQGETQPAKLARQGKSRSGAYEGDVNAEASIGEHAGGGTGECEDIV